MFRLITFTSIEKTSYNVILSKIMHLQGKPGPEGPIGMVGVDGLPGDQGPLGSMGLPGK